jgi:alanyl-tRNA synthetase
VLDRTPFYAEGGGQIGDRGVLSSGGVPVFHVDDTQKPVGQLIVHRGRLAGTLRVGDTALATVDERRRAATMRNHTATHLLHRALRTVVGPSARQAGSLVAPEYLRFDFPLDRALTSEETAAIEEQVRAVIRDDRPVSVAHAALNEAIEAGADAFFDEKYGAVVRTVSVQDYSRELCGGTHCRATGQIGGFFVTGERSIGSGIRRIEAVTGEAADALVSERFALLASTAEALGVHDPAQAPARAAELQVRARELERRLRAGSSTGTARPGEVAQAAAQVDGVPVVAYAAPFEGQEEMKHWARDLRGVLGSGVIAVGLEADQPVLFVTVSDDLVRRGVSAADLVRAGVEPIEGRGGGRPEMAQGRGARRDGLPEALERVRAAVASALDGSA